MVDDDEQLGHVLSEFLLREGYEVWTAHDGVQGYSTYCKSQPEVVVTDIEMPRLDGIGMMTCIRTINPAVKTIYISGAAAEHRLALTIEAQEFGAPVLRKPFMMMDLLDLLSSFVQKGITSFARKPYEGTSLERR